MLIKYKRILSMTLISVILFGMLSSVFATPSSWSEDYIKSMLLEGMISDTVSDSSKFQQAITREEFAELVVMLYAKAKNIKVEDINAWNPFVDSTNPMVSKAYNLGIVNGTGKDKDNRMLFSPKKNVTRQEIAVMLVKAMKQLDINTIPYKKLTFSDASQVSNWASDAVRFVTEAGILLGVGNNQINPKHNATREQSLVLIAKIGMKYGWIKNETETPKFNASNATQIMGFSVPNYEKSQLRSSHSTKNITFIISLLVSDSTVDIKTQQYDLINILVNSNKISYDALSSVYDYILNSYDFTSQSFKHNKTIYINSKTGQTSGTELAKPYVKLSGTDDFKFEYQE